MSKTSLHQLLKSLMYKEPKNLLQNMFLCDFNAFERGRNTVVCASSAAHCSKGSRKVRDVAN